MKISEMKLNEVNSLTLLVRNVEEKSTRNGDPFLTYTLTDGEKDITAKQWGAALANVKYGKGQLAIFVINAGTYNGEPNFIVNQIYAPNADADISQFVKMPPETPESIYEELVKASQLIIDENLGKAVRSILAGNHDKLIKWGAAKGIHHNFRGGLLWHTVRMLRMALEGIKVYSSLSSDVVIAGTMLHDIGKLIELETDDFGDSVYTVGGQLFGHLLYGYETVKKELEDCGVSKELKESVLHVLVSHHGKLEWGAITAPHSAEAFFVSQIDMIDAMMYRYEEAGKDIEPGTIGNARIDGIPVYKSVTSVMPAPFV